jgi:hypothetical protein
MVDVKKKPHPSCFEALCERKSKELMAKAFEKESNLSLLAQIV